MWWPSPHGPGRCLACPAVAVLVVQDRVGNEADVCIRHWEEALRRSDGRVRGVRLIGDPAPDD
jgi:hypothetical protein